MHQDTRHCQTIFSANGDYDILRSISIDRTWRMDVLAPPPSGMCATIYRTTGPLFSSMILCSC